MGISISLLAKKNQLESFTFNGISYLNNTGMKDTAIILSVSSLILICGWKFMCTKSSSCGGKQNPPHIPEDIIRLHILTRLPVKSLARFKCVCKSWKSIINYYDPAFVTSYMSNNSFKHREDDGVMIECYNLKYSVKKNHERPLLPDFVTDIVGSVNGLVCLQTLNKKKIAKIGLWNPFTRMYKDVVLPPSSTTLTLDGFYHNFSLSLGFDHIKNDYKLIFIWRDGDNAPLKADVYSCNAGSWCNINVTSSFLSRLNDPVYGTIYANGSNYWRARAGLSNYVQSFDIVNEVFRTIPDNFEYTPDRQPILMVNLRDSLAQIVYDLKYDVPYVDMCVAYVEVYVLNQTMDCGDSTWSKLYRVGPLRFPVYHLHILGCLSIRGDLVFISNENLKLLQIDEQRQAILNNSNHPLGPSVKYYPGSGTTYTRTLVFVKGMKPISLECAPTIFLAFVVGGHVFN